jgi:hypothetical protein
MRLSLGALIVLVASAQAQDFRWPLDAIAGKDPRAVVVADFDLDGRPDFATAQYDSNSVSIVLASPGGDIEAPILLEVGKQYSDLGVGDFDLDGRPDLVATNRLDPWLRIFDNDSGWTWCGAQGAIVADALAVGDMDGDGRPDVVVADSFSNVARVFLTDANGCPTAPLAFATGTKPIDVALADLDGDGALDVVTCNETVSTLSLLRGDGTGALLPATSVAVGSVPTALVAADLDQDGDADVAVSSSATRKVRLFFGDGAGGLAGGASTTFPAFTKPARVVADDLDADGLADLVVVSAASSSGGFGVMRGTGGGVFAAPVMHFSPLANGGALAVADMDEDGRLDVLLDATDDSIFVALGDGAGGFPTPAGPAMPQDAIYSTLGDLNGDGADDLVSTPYLGGPPNAVSVQLGDGAGDWLPGVVQPALATSVLHLADLNGDGALDLLSGNEFSGLVAALGDGAGGLGASTASSGIEVMRIATADIDGDGFADAIVDGEEPTFFGDPQFMLKVYRGDGAGGFVAYAHLLTYDLWDPFGGEPKPPHGQAQAGDLDGDGDADIVFSGHQQSRVWLNMAGSLGAGTAIVAGNAYALGTDALRLADFDGDGRLDMLTINETYASVLYGTGTGSFGPSVQLAPIKSVSSLEVADIDLDGRLDLVVGRSAGTISVLRNDGAGGVQARTYFSSGVTRLFTTDADSDGFTDVMTDSFGGNILLVNQALHGAWADLGSGLAGVDGIPKLVATGTLAPGSPGTLKLSHANPSKLCALFVSKQSNPAPFKGGVLVPVPPLASFLIVTSPSGSVNLSWAHWPPGPAGVSWHFQYAIVDSTAPVGVSLSNAVRGTQPGP